MRKVGEVASGAMDVLITHQCKTGYDMWDMGIVSHRRWLLRARVCIFCNGGALCPPNRLLKHRSCKASDHLPQGVETGDLRSSRHIPQVSSDMLSANVAPTVNTPRAVSWSMYGSLSVRRWEMRDATRWSRVTD